MTPFRFWHAFAWLLLIFAATQPSPTEHQISGILRETPQSVVKKSGGRRTLEIWRFNGEPVRAYHLWKTVQVMVDFVNNVNPSDYAIYNNVNKSEIEKEHEGNSKFVNAVFRKFLPTWQPATFLHPFTPTYVGVESQASYNIGLEIKNVDFRLAIVFAAGIALFFAAHRLSRSTIAFYAGGTSLGIVGSLLIVLFLLYRMAPKRSVAFTVLIGGSSIVGAILCLVWKNLYSIITEHYKIVAVYLVSVALISFGVSYYYGPPKGVRTQNLVQWTLQLIALGMVYAGSQIPAISVATMVAMIIANNLPRYFGNQLEWIRYRLFPPKRRLLTEDEYIAEGARETKKALDELREYCRSPGCDSWKVMSRLRSPQQFAEFVSGHRSHISDDEILNYTNDSFMNDLEYDEDDEEESGSEASSSTRNGGPPALATRFRVTTSTPSEYFNRSHGQLETRQRNDAGQRYYQSFDGRDTVTSSAPSRLTRNSRYEFR